MKKNVLIGMVIASLFVVGCAVVKCNESVTPEEQSVQAVATWHKKNPQLFSNVGYIKQLEESAPKLAKLSESLEELRGVSTNPFGIRDDILQYIFTNIPESNESATKAAIKLMQYMQQIYYGNLTESEALVKSQWQNIAFSCLVDYLEEENHKGVTNAKDGGKLMNMMGDTKARNEYMWAIDRKYFSWKVLGTGLTTGEEEKVCKEGKL